MSIHILSDNLINKIAAGEVVERPASVVKELVENSLDAGADFITVEIKNGGIDLIEVTDNGKGMNREDAKLSVGRYATSKIFLVEDLFSLSSFGFRGEALAAISSVSRFTLQTKEKGAIVGTEIKFEEGNLKAYDAGCPEGAKVKVENLFYNVPARKKFLKSSATEFSHILNTMLNIAIVNFKARFKLIHNEKVIFDYSSYLKKSESERSDIDRDKKWRGERVKVILGNDIFFKMLGFYKEEGDMILQGFISNPAAVRTNKSHQYLFVNNRPVYNNIINKAIYEAYRNVIPKDSHPMFVISLEIEPELVDVNVHPRKMEVKFLYQQEVFKSMELIIKNALNKVNKTFAASSPFADNPVKEHWIRGEGKVFENSNHFNPLVQDKGKSYSVFSNFQRSFSGYSKEKTAEFNRRMFEEEKAEIKKEIKPFLEEGGEWKLLGQIKNLYLVVETKDGLVLIDQHAAHERMIYEKLKENEREHKFKSQQLLSPLKLDLSLKEWNIVKQNLENFKNIGFEIEDFGMNTIIIHSIPQDISGKDLTAIIKGMLSDLLLELGNDLIDNKNTLDDLRNKMIEYLACHGAIKAGDELSSEEQKDLVEKVILGHIKPTCPHGRPIMTILNWDELGKKFKRA